LFAAPDPTLVKRLSTKALRGPRLLDIKNLKRMYLEIRDNYGQGVAFTGTITSRGGPNPGGAQECGFQLAAGQEFSIEPWPLSGGGIEAMIDLETVSPDATIERLHLSAEERTLFGA
jgi:hypothetical protein